MFFKTFRQFFIFCLIQQVTLKVYVSGKPMQDDEAVPTSNEQLRILAEYVCLDLEQAINVTLEGCLENFWKSPFPLNSNVNSSKYAPVVKIRCNFKYSARFQIEPSHNWQLVVLVPQLINETEADMYSINYALIEPFKEYEAVSTVPSSNYTLWSTELIDGVPIFWRGGLEVPPYHELPPSEQKKYVIKVDFTKADVQDRVLVNALLRWNTSGDDDVCFDVVNSCYKTDIIEDTKIWPDSKPEKTFTNLIADDSCNVKVIGLHGTSTLAYDTPPCDDYSDCQFDPEIPKNISIEASEETPDTWKVRVRWAPPRHAVERYNVTLLSHDMWTQEVPGDETEAVFKGVSGERLYSVWIYAILGHKAAVTSRRALFPTGRASGAAGAARAGAVALGAAACAGAALALACLWRRRATLPAPPDLPPEDKPVKKTDIEAVSMIVETEDSWEMRSDKLLLHEVIGEGAFGVVRRATLAPSGINVAVKMLKDFPSLEEIRSFRSEMELMKSVGVHPHLVSLVGCCSGRRPLIVAEYCSRGDLLTYLRCTWDVMVSKRNAKYYNNNVDTSDYRNDLFKCRMQTENSKLVVNKLYELQDICDKELTSLDLLSFCRQIAMGMEFLAANRVVHRDLAARNILVTGDRTLKIADFGLSRDVYEENQYKQKGNGKMPVKWMALESLTRRIYTTQSDVWSFGVVVWEVATVGAAPYAAVPAARLPRLLRSGYRMPRPANCSPQLYDIMLSCWRTHPRERPTFAELHSRLDELLNSASAHHYLSLEIEPVDAPPTPKHHRYIKMFMRGKRNWSRGESYERPVKPPQTNHYTSPPAGLAKPPV